MNKQYFPVFSNYLTSLWNDLLFHYWLLFANVFQSHVGRTPNYIMKKHCKTFIRVERFFVWMLLHIREMNQCECTWILNGNKNFWINWTYFSEPISVILSSDSPFDQARFINIFNVYRQLIENVWSKIIRRLSTFICTDKLDIKQFSWPTIFMVNIPMTQQHSYDEH